MSVDLPKLAKFKLPQQTAVVIIGLHRLLQNVALGLVDVHNAVLKAPLQIIVKEVEPVGNNKKVAWVSFDGGLSCHLIEAF